MLASTIFPLMALLDTPTVSAILGNSSRYSLVETAHISVPSMYWPRPRSLRSIS